MIYENADRILIRESGFMALAACYPYGTGAELEIEIYRDGNRKVAADICVHGGKLPQKARTPSVKLLHKLLSRARVYARLLKRYGIAYQQHNNFFEITSA